MAGPWGVTPAGFLGKPLTQVAAEVDADLQVILGSSAGTEPDGTIPVAGFAGQLKSLIVDGVAAQWDLQQAVYSSRDPNQATAASQDAVCAITGTTREPAQFSTVTLACVGTPNTSLPVGRVVSVTGTGALFSGPDGTIAALAAWVGGSTYAAGQQVTNAGNAYQCTVGGVAAGSGGPTTTGSSIVDGGVTWAFLGVGVGAVNLAFVAEVVGPIGALAGTLVNIVTPVNGWNAATNVTDAAVGALQEMDIALRARRDAELAGAGNTTRDAILARVTKVNEGSGDPNHEPPTAVEVFANATAFTDVNGVPPYSVEVMVLGGTDADIAQAIWDSVGAGTPTVGNQTSTVTDSEGNPQTVYWTRPTQVQMYVTAVLGYDASQWPPGTQSSLVAQAGLSALLTETTGWGIGVDVRTSPLIAAFLRGPSQTDASGLAVVPATPGSAAASGILEVVSIFIDRNPAPSSPATVSIAVREVAVFTSTNMLVTATTETP